MIGVAIVRDGDGRLAYQVRCSEHGLIGPKWSGHGRDIITPALGRHERMHRWDG